jgi:hypothetical protein
MEARKVDDPLVWVKDNEGNEFICQASSLKDPKSIGEEEKKNCVDSAKVHQPHAGG